MSRGNEFQPKKRFSTERHADDGLPIYTLDQLEEHRLTYFDHVLATSPEINFTELKPCYVDYPDGGRYYEHKIAIGLEKEFEDIGYNSIDIEAKPVSKLQPAYDEGLGEMEALVYSPKEVTGYLIELTLVTGELYKVMTVIVNKSDPASIKQILITIAQAFLTNTGTLKKLWNTSLQPLRGEITYREDFDKDESE